MLVGWESEQREVEAPSDLGGGLDISYSYITSILTRDLTET